MTLLLVEENGTVKFDRQVLDPRRAGQTRRYHTWPHLREQSVAEHGWQVARILLAIWPDAPAALVTEALFHDCGEQATGDLPYPMKATSPTLKRIMDGLERDARLAMTRWGLPPPRRQDEWEAAALKVADLLDMWEWALDELALGNAHAGLVRRRCEVAIRLRLRDANSLEEGTLRYMERRTRHEAVVHGRRGGES